jgi:hydroxymethylpyrimidine pyrophosphatase-like HAD family hydrolase
MSEELPVNVQDWVAADLDGTLFSRHWKSEHAVPGTWREVMGGDGSRQREASSWVRPGVHRLLLALSRVAAIVPVTARDAESFSRVDVEGVRLRGPAILANGAIILDTEGAPDARWVAQMSQTLGPWQERLDKLCDIFVQRSGHVARPRLVAGTSDLAAYLVAKAPQGWWSGEAGAALLAELVADVSAECRVAVLGDELQILPPGLGKSLAAGFVQQHYFKDQAPLLCLGDQPSDLEFMNLGEMLATPAASAIAKIWTP